MAQVQERLGKLKGTYALVHGVPMYARVSVEKPAANGLLPVVLVHGLAVSSRYMVPLAERLAPYTRVYAPDLPGYGNSFKPSYALHVPELANALAAWMQAVGLERAALVGNSFGCQVVVDLAARYPDRVARTVLLAPTVDPHARTPLHQFGRWLRDVPYERKSLGLIIARDVLVDMGLPRTIAMFGRMLEDRVETKLPQVRVPSLVVRGTLDPIVPQYWAEEATGLLPLGRLRVMPGLPHAPNYSAPTEVARIVRAFLCEPVEGGASGALQ